jgi:hypothetical protein
MQLYTSKTILPLLCLSLRLEGGTIFNDFGPGETFNTTSGYSLGQGALQGNGGALVAAAFTPSTTTAVAGLDLAVKVLAQNPGPNQINFWLMSDIGGNPGVIMESFSFTNALTVFPPIILSAVSTLHPVLTGGTRYWVAAGPTDLINSQEAWMFNIIGATGTLSIKTGAGPWNAVQGVSLPAFDVTSVPGVPEPSSMLLLTCGLAGLYLGRKRCT